jgi:hypothetical protein
MFAFEESKGRGETLALIQELSNECAALGGPLSKRLNALVQRGAYRELIDFEIDPYAVDKDEVTDYLYARQIKALVEKQDFLDVGYDREKEALSKFRAAEEKCRATNTRLWSERPERDVASVLHTAQRIIAEILGRVPEFAEMSFLFGPGASTNVVGRVAGFRTKLAAPMQCSESLVGWLGSFLAEFPQWCDAVAVKHNSYSSNAVGGRCLESESLWDKSWTVPVEVRPARISFVPKTSKTDRTICVEPSLNALGQKGIGSYMKDRLGLYGVNLRDQSRNQRRACEGSVSGSYATIDLSSASDTVSYALVMSLLPLGWFDLLDHFRSESVELGEELIVLEKFSSMGNAYTFELESLIFYSLALAVCDYLNLVGMPVFDHRGSLGRGFPVEVYGDDIIVPVGAYSLLEKVLQWCGFELNSKKSFCHGYFRESCGADWLFGFDVRPWYLKKEVSERSLYVAHNFFMRKQERSLARICLHRTVRKKRLFGPDGYGDGHLLGSYTLNTRKGGIGERGYEGGYFRSWKGVPNRYDRAHQTDVLIPSYSVYARMGEEEATDPYIVRGTKLYRTTSIYTTMKGIFRTW